jgi:hypothetical protein
VVDLGLRKGREKFLNFSDDPIPEKEIFVFLVANAKPTPLDYFSGVHLVISHLLEFYSGIFEHRSMINDQS